MFTFTKLAVASLALGGTLFAAGCAAQSPAAVAKADHAAACSKCEVTSVKSPILGDKNRIVGYKDTTKMTCPDCKDAVASLLTGGKPQHTCKTCGDATEICQAH